jgi:thioredoxin 1
MKAIADAEFQEAVVDAHAAGKTVVVDFWASWCAPCRALAPVLEQLALKYPDVVFVKVNVEENQGKTEEFDIKGLPCVQIWRPGKPLNTSLGAKPASHYEALLTEA